jgi:hypothetical protein
MSGTNSWHSEEYGPIVTIIVGPDRSQRTFYVYKRLLTHYSIYFRTALKDCWLEGTTKKVILSDEIPEVFQAFFTWLYAGRLYSSLDVAGKIPFTVQLICQIFVFGDARGAPEFCNAAINLLYQKLQQDWAFPVFDLDCVYENTQSNSSLRRLLVNFAVEAFRFESIKDPMDRSLDHYPKEFLADVITAFMTLEKKPIPSIAGYPTGGVTKVNWTSYTKGSVCQKYHDHSAAEHS